MEIWTHTHLGSLGVQASRRMIWPAFAQTKPRVVLQVQQGVHWSAALAKELSLSAPVGYAACGGVFWF